LAPARTDPEVIIRLNSGIRAALATAAVQKTMTALGADIVADRPDEFAKFIEREIEKGAAIVKVAGIKL
jgi:tripartite-type tricarboxylate transporter receptor subunit TctC